jgi:hypothetical protein
MAGRTSRFFQAVETNRIQRSRVVLTQCLQDQKSAGPDPGHHQKGDPMKKRAIANLSAVVMLSALMLVPLAIRADAPIRNDNLMPVLGPGLGTIVDGMGNPITMSTPAGTLIFNSSPDPMGVRLPVLAPDGHQLTFGEFLTPEGRAGIHCINQGTKTTVHFSGLVPKGVYTVWLFIFGPTDPPLIAWGAAGRLDPVQNSFTASEAGEGQLSVTNPAGPLSGEGSIGPCWLENFLVHVVLVYHIDGMTYGPLPGPDYTWVFQAAFIFQQGMPVL